jgi:hypothetical protein
MGFPRTLKRRYLLDDTPYQESPTSVAADPRRRGSGAVDRRRGQSVAPHDVMVLYPGCGTRSSAICRSPPSIAGGADSHPTGARGNAIPTSRSARRCSRPSASITGGCDRRPGCFRGGSTAAVAGSSPTPSAPTGSARGRLPGFGDVARAVHAFAAHPGVPFRTWKSYRAGRCSPNPVCTTSCSNICFRDAAGW